MSKLVEEWKPVVGYEGLYEVSDWGRVKSLARVCKYWRGGWRTVPEKILIQIPDGRGYLMVGLFKNGKKTTARVHRLVYEAFNGEIPAELQVNHIDENKENNCLWNLNLMTSKENNNWGTRNERATKTLTNHPDKSKPVIACNPETMEIVYEFPSTAEAGRNGFKSSAVGLCCRGCYSHKGNHTYKGLDWYYI